MKNKKITLYELIGLIKDNKPPKKIKINNHTFCFNENYESIEELYYSDFGNNEYWYRYSNIKLDTIVEILPEENDEWEDIEEINIEDEIIYILKTDRYQKVNDREKYIVYPVINQLIKNQKYLKERLDKDELK